jgi:hypothetical protein
MKYISKRKSCLNTLQFLKDSFESSKEIFFLSCLYLDILIINNPQLNYDLAIVCSYLLACKIQGNEGIQKNFAEVPKISQISNIMKNAYNESQILAYEKVCLNLLNYDLNLHSAFIILKYFLFNGILTKEEIRKKKTSLGYNNHSMSSHLIYMEEKCLDFLLEFICDERYLDFANDQYLIACSILAFTRMKFNFTPFPKEFEIIYNLKFSSLNLCFFVTSSIIENYNENKRNHSQNINIKSTDGVQISPIQKDEEREPFLPIGFFVPFLLDENLRKTYIHQKSQSIKSKSSRNSTNSTLDHTKIINSSNFLNFTPSIYSVRRSSAGAALLYQ